MNKGVRITLIVVGAVGVAIAIWLMIRKMTRATDDQFYAIYKAMQSRGMDLLDMSGTQLQSALDSFKKHLSKAEADRMLMLIPKANEGTAEQQEVIALYNKMMKSFKK
jgi:Ca2+-binding EF-hand superfamily protein